MKKTLKWLPLLLACTLVFGCDDGNGGKKTDNGGNNGGNNNGGNNGGNNNGPGANPGLIDIPAAKFQIIGMEPAAGLFDQETSVTIYGKNFEGDVSVKFGDLEGLDISVLSSSKLTVKAPRVDSPREVDVIVSSGGETLVAKSKFKYVSPEVNQIEWCRLNTPNLEAMTDNNGKMIKTATAYVELYDDLCANDGKCDFDVQFCLSKTPTEAEKYKEEDYNCFDAKNNEHFNVVNNKEYQAEFPDLTSAPEQGSAYPFFAKVKLKNSQEWQYCGPGEIANQQHWKKEIFGKLNVRTNAKFIEFCSTHHPKEMKSEVNADGKTTSKAIFGRVYVKECTEGADKCADIEAQVGVGPKEFQAAALEESFTWVNAEYNAAHPGTATDGADNDEYMAKLNYTGIGESAYLYRFRLKGDNNWVYCDTDTENKGFEPSKVGKWTIAPKPVPEKLKISYAVLKYPDQKTFTAGEAKAFDVYGQAHVKNCTENNNRCETLKAQIGYKKLDDKKALNTFTWKDAAYHAENTSNRNNNEFKYSLEIKEEGQYAYLYRFSLDGDTWIYGDKMGMLENDAVVDYQPGLLTVTKDPSLSVDYCAVVFPKNVSSQLPEGKSKENVKTGMIYSQVYVPGCTNGRTTKCDKISAQIGFATKGTALTDTSWKWSDAAYNEKASLNSQTENNDEYQAELNAEFDLTNKAIVEMNYAFRYSADGKKTWTYCDKNNKIADIADPLAQIDLPVWSVTKAPEKKVTWCRVMPMQAISKVKNSTEQATSPELEAQALVEGCTDGFDNQCKNLKAQIAIVKPGETDASNFDWTDAHYKKEVSVGNNDGFVGTLTAGIGKHSYVYRFRVGDGEWKYCDTNADDDFKIEQAGTWEVKEGEKPAVKTASIQFPLTDIQLLEGETSPKIYSRVTVEHCSTDDHTCPDVKADFVVCPATVNDITRLPASCVITAANDNTLYNGEGDEYEVTYTGKTVGEYIFAFRYIVESTKAVTFALNNGEPGKIIVKKPEVPQYNVSCTLQHPEALEIPINGKVPVFSRIYVQDCTNNSEQTCGKIEKAQLVLVNEKKEETFIDAIHNKEGSAGPNNHEYRAMFIASVAGKYDYYYCYTFDNGQVKNCYLNWSNDKNNVGKADVKIASANMKLKHCTVNVKHTAMKSDAQNTLFAAKVEMENPIFDDTGNWVDITVKYCTQKDEEGSQCTQDGIVKEGDFVRLQQHTYTNAGTLKHWFAITVRGTEGETRCLPPNSEEVATVEILDKDYAIESQNLQWISAYNANDRVKVGTNFDIYAKVKVNNACTDNPNTPCNALTVFVEYADNTNGLNVERAYNFMLNPGGSNGNQHEYHKALKIDKVGVYYFRVGFSVNGSDVIYTDYSRAITVHE